MKSKKKLGWIHPAAYICSRYDQRFIGCGELSDIACPTKPGEPRGQIPIRRIVAISEPSEQIMR